MGSAALRCVNHDISVAFDDDAALMKSLADMMGVVLKQTGSAGAITPVWDRVVGDVIARHTRPVLWEGKTLVIRCDAEAWREALEPEKASLAKKLAAALGEPEVNLVLDVSKENVKENVKEKR